MTTNYQHIIPAWYAAGFSFEKKKTLRDSPVYFCDQRSKKILPNKVGNILWENQYFEIDYDFYVSDMDIHYKKAETVNLIENWIQDIEIGFLNICDRMNDSLMHWKKITEEDWQVLIDYVIHIHMRTPRKRREILDIWNTEINKKYENNPKAVENHKATLQCQWLDPSVMDKYLSAEWIKTVSDTIASWSVIWYKKKDIFYEAEKIRFNKYGFDFVASTREEEFISCDHPVVIGKRCILFPITKKICLVLSTEAISLSVSRINSAIASNAENTIFWPNENVVNKYKNCLTIKNSLVLRHLDEELDENCLEEEIIRMYINSLQDAGIF